MKGRIGWGRIEMIRKETEGRIELLGSDSELKETNQEYKIMIP